MRGDRDIRSRSVCLTFNFLIVKNSHFAFSPAGVPSVLHVLSVMVPSEPPVARTPMREYSRSWNANEVIGGNGEIEVQKLRSNVAIGRALTVCRHSLYLEHVAMYPYKIIQPSIFQYVTEERLQCFH